MRPSSVGAADLAPDVNVIGRDRGPPRPRPPGRSPSRRPEPTPEPTPGPEPVVALETRSPASRRPMPEVYADQPVQDPPRPAGAVAVPRTTTG